VALALLLTSSLSCRRRTPAGLEVWAEVDGQPIFRDQVERVYRSRAAAGAAASNSEEAMSFQLSILNELINNQILLAHAAHARITVSEAEVDTKVAELQSPYTKDEFQNKLKDQGMDMSELRQEVRRSLIINKLINKEIISRISVSDAEVAQYYERNKASFNFPETDYHLAQIEVTPGPDAEVRNLKNDDAKTPAMAERKIQALHARLQAGEDFATVAQEYSEDARTAAGGGDMGFIPASALDASPQLKQVVTSMKVGQFSGIFRTNRGYHIVKLLGKEEAGQRRVNDPQVRNAIRRTLMNEKEQLLKAAYIEVLRNRAKVVNHLAEQVVNSMGGSGEQRD